MGERKRSSRRNRRAPVRHPIKMRPEPERAERAKRRAPGDGGDPDLARLPEFEPVMLGMLTKIPLEVLPLYAAVAIVHAEMSGAQPQACVPVCFQLAGALEHLGFEAEVMAACATVYHREDQDTKFADIGVWDRPPIVRPDGSTNGHAVLWADSFGRLIDPTIAQAPKLLAAAHDDPSFTLPTSLPVPGREQLLAMEALVTGKGPFLISWQLFPEWTGALAPVLRGDLGEAMPYGSLLLAHAVVDLLDGLAKYRADLTRLHTLYPPLGELLAGRRRLPDLPADPPTAFIRSRNAARPVSDVPPDSRE